MKRKYWPTLLLVLSWAVCLALLARLWIDRHGQVKNVQWQKPAAVPAVITPVAITEPAGLGGDPAQFAPIVERPLLALDRRPPPPPPPPKPPPPPPPPDALAGAHLFGLVAGDEGAVLLRAEGRMHTVQIDKTVGDWVLKSIDERSATFARGEERRTLPLEFVRLNKPPVALARAGDAAGPSGPPAASIGGVAIPTNLPEAARKELEERLRRRAALANR